MMQYQTSATYNFSVGAESVTISHTGSTKRRLTVVLTVSAAGDMLPTKVIFKGKRALKLQVPSGWMVTVHPKGWMDENLLTR